MEEVNECTTLYTTFPNIIQARVQGVAVKHIVECLDYSSVKHRTSVYCVCLACERQNVS